MLLRLLLGTLLLVVAMLLLTLLLVRMLRLCAASRSVLPCLVIICQPYLQTVRTRVSGRCATVQLHV